MSTRTRNVQFTTTPQERRLITSIVDRAAAMKLLLGSHLDLEMDLSATHANGTPLDFTKLLGADDFNFIHDVAGIQRRLDRSTGELTGFFLPRCAKPELPGVPASMYLDQDESGDPRLVTKERH